MLTPASLHPEALSTRCTDATAFFDPSAPNYGKTPPRGRRSLYGFHELHCLGDQVRLPMGGNKVGHNLAKSVGRAFARWSTRHSIPWSVSFAYDWPAMELVITRKP